MIVEYNSEPILCIEETKEAGTGHNSMQRFARIAAAVENNVPAIYIMPEAVIVSCHTTTRGKKATTTKWDSLNPIVFQAFNSVMDIFKIPALFFYYPSDYRKLIRNPEKSPNLLNKGIVFNKDLAKYPGCPAENDEEMQSLFKVINTIIQHAIAGNPVSSVIDSTGCNTSPTRSLVSVQ